MPGNFTDNRTAFHGLIPEIEPAKPEKARKQQNDSVFQSLNWLSLSPMYKASFGLYWTADAPTRCAPLRGTLIVLDGYIGNARGR